MNAYTYDWPIVEVEWIDATSCGTWQAQDDWELHNMSIRSTGYLFKDLSDRVVLVQSLAALDNIDHQLSIPRSAIKSIVYLWDGEDE